MKKVCGGVLGVATFLFGLLVVLPAGRALSPCGLGLMFILVWVLMNCLILVFNKGREATAWLSGGTVGLLQSMAPGTWSWASAMSGRWSFEITRR